MRQDIERLPTSHGLVPAQGHRQPGTRQGINFPLSRGGGRAPWQCFPANISWLYLWVTLASHCSLLSSVPAPCRSRGILWLLTFPMLDTPQPPARLTASPSTHSEQGGRKSREEELSVWMGQQKPRLCHAMASVLSPAQAVPWPLL